MKCLSFSCFFFFYVIPCGRIKVQEGHNLRKKNTCMSSYVDPHVWILGVCMCVYVRACACVFRDALIPHNHIYGGQKTTCRNSLLPLCDPGNQLRYRLGSKYLTLGAISLYPALLFKIDSWYE